MLIKEHPILDIKEKKIVNFLFNGKEIQGFEGEPIIASLIANGVSTLAYSYRHHRPRGMFCANGKCSACLMEVDGKRNVRVCITKLKAGMKVNIQE